MCDNQVVNGETKAGGCKLPIPKHSILQPAATYTSGQTPSTLSYVPRPRYASQHTSTRSSMPPSSAPA